MAGASLVAQMVKLLPAMRETWVLSLGWDDPLEEDMATHSSMLAWRISMDRGAWWATVHEVSESDTTEWLSRAQWQKVQRNQKASWWRWKRSEKAGLKLNIQKMKITTSGPITSWQIDGQKNSWGKVTDFIFLGSKITADSNCIHEIKRHLLRGRKAMTNLDSILKSRDITLLTKVHIVKALVFPIVMYRCESWTIKKNKERQRIDVFKLWCWRRLFRVPWTARRSN